MNIFVPPWIYFIHFTKLNLWMLSYLMEPLLLFIILVLQFFHPLFLSHMFFILLILRSISFQFLSSFMFYLIKLILYLINVSYRIWNLRRWLVWVVFVMVSIGWILPYVLRSLQCLLPQVINPALIRMFLLVVVIQFVQMLLFHVFLLLQSSTLD